VLAYFLGAVVVFTLCVLLMVWYSRFMFAKIYGDIRKQVDFVVSGAAPPEWGLKLAGRLSRCRTEREKEAAVLKHKRYADKRLMDLIAFMKSTSVVASEAEREADVERLELFRREYPAVVDGFITGPGTYAKTLAGDKNK
jgi:hypothetical protein